MVENHTPSAAEIHKAQVEARAFRETKLGALFTAFENKHARAWQTDCREGASDAVMKRDWDASNAARAALVTAMKEIQDTLQQIADAAPCERSFSNEVARAALSQARA